MLSALDRTPQRCWVLRGAGQALIPQLGGSSLSPKTQLLLLSHLQSEITQGPCHHCCANHATPSPTWGLGMPSPSLPLGRSLDGLGSAHPLPRLALAWVPGYCFCLCCCATGWVLVATSPCSGRRWVPYAGAFIPSADRQPAVWLSNPNCSQCAWTKSCLERWQGLGADDTLGIFPLPWTPAVSSPSSCKNGRQQLGFAGKMGCLPPVPRRVGAESCPKAG